MSTKKGDSSFKAVDSEGLNIDDFIAYFKRSPPQYFDRFLEFRRTSEQCSPPPTPPPGPPSTIKHRMIFENEQTQMIPDGYEIFYQLCVMEPAKETKEKKDDKNQVRRYYPRVFAAYQEFDYADEIKKEKKPKGSRRTTDSKKPKETKQTNRYKDAYIALVHDVPKVMDEATTDDVKMWRSETREIRPLDYHIFLVRHMIVSWEDYLNDIEPQTEEAAEEFLSSSQETIKPSKGKEPARSTPSPPPTITLEDYETAAKHLRFLGRLISKLKITHYRLRPKEFKFDSNTKKLGEMMSRQQDSVEELLKKVEDWIKSMPDLREETWEDLVDMILSDDPEEYNENDPGESSSRGI